MGYVRRTQDPALPLKVEHERFCRAYLEHFDPERAAVDAGFPERWQRDRARALLRSKRVQARMGYLANLELGAVGVHVHRIVREYARIGFHDITAVRLDANGNLDPALPKDVTAAIKKFKRTVRSFGSFEDDSNGVEVVTEVEMHAKQPALDALSKYTDLFPKEAKPGSSPDEPLHIVIRRE